MARAIAAAQTILNRMACFIADTSAESPADSQGRKIARRENCLREWHPRQEIGTGKNTSQPLLGWQGAFPAVTRPRTTLAQPFFPGGVVRIMDHRFSQSPAIRILVVEDFRPFRALIRSLLGENGQFQVLGEASDGLEAVEKAQRLGPDVILMDIGLPKLNGL